MSTWHWHLTCGSTKPGALHIGQACVWPLALGARIQSVNKSVLARFQVLGIKQWIRQARIQLCFVLNEVKSSSASPRSRGMRNLKFVMFAFGGGTFIRSVCTFPGSHTLQNMLKWALRSSDHISSTAGYSWSKSLWSLVQATPNIYRASDKSTDGSADTVH